MERAADEALIDQEIDECTEKLEQVLEYGDKQGFIDADEWRRNSREGTEASRVELDRFRMTLMHGEEELAQEIMDKAHVDEIEAGWRADGAIERAVYSQEQEWLKLFVDTQRWQADLIKRVLDLNASYTIRAFEELCDFYKGDKPVEKFTEANLWELIRIIDATKKDNL